MMHDITSLAVQALPPASLDQSHHEDEVAATQQSILEELHTISEEAIMHHPHRDRLITEPNALEAVHAQQTDEVLQQSNAADIREVPNSEPSSPQAAQLPSPLFPEFGEHAILLPKAQSTENAVPSEVPTDEVAVDIESETEPVPAKTEDVAETAETAVESTAEPRLTSTEAKAEAVVEAAPVSDIAAPEVEQLQAAFTETAQQQLTAAITTEATLAVTELVNTMNDHIDADLDHTDLFDGIDAGAFSDIELSPPVRRQSVLPSLDGSISAIRGHAPASPTRTRSPQASQTLNGLELSLGVGDEPPEQLPEPSQMASFLDPQFAGFKTGHGRQVKPSEKALEAARKLLLDLEESQDPLIPPAASQASSSQLQSRAFETPSKVGLPASTGGLGRPMADRPPMQEILPKQSSVVPNRSQGQSPLARSKVAPSQVMSVSQAMSASQLERQPFATPKPIRGGLFSSAAALASPVRTPAAASGSRFTTPQPSKRIGMMPRVDIGGSTARKRTLPKFVTPFKNGKRLRTDEPDDPASPLRKPGNGLMHDLHRPSPVANRHYPPPQRPLSKAGPSSEGPAVFNLSSIAPRHKLSDVGRPEQVSALQMIAKGVPDEVLVILNDASRAAQYAFEAPNGDLLMQQNALDELHARGCSNATLPWVSNHWILILWKLAAMVRLDPASAHERWSWSELIRQMLYRYEREVHRAQRSCLKRIQEHDSSPARPMVLFVSRIMEEENEVQERTREIVMRKSTLLELSDGWYRISAQLDPVLASACQRGRLRIGQKLAIMGATLDAQGEGNEVLQAYHMSSLVLSSNSVSLARWDAKLGFAPQPFCASLRSLTPEGGLVSLMDVVITKVFPLAYVDVERNGGPSAPRGEQEEAEEREVWLKRKEDVMQQLEMKLESESRKLYDLVEALSDLASDSFLPSIPDDPTGRLEANAQQLFDQLRAKEDPASAVRDLIVARGHSNLVPWLHGMAKSALLADDMGSGGGRLGADLDRACPPRKVREFRVVRFRDARLPPPSPSTSAAGSSAGGGATKKKNPHARTVQLTVWDAAQLGEELQEGRRFWVTNLMPSSKSAWRKPDDAADVFLSTRRDTKWRAVS